MVSKCCSSSPSGFLGKAALYFVLVIILVEGVKAVQRLHISSRVIEMARRDLLFLEVFVAKVNSSESAI